MDMETGRILAATEQDFKSLTDSLKTMEAPAAASSPSMAEQLAQMEAGLQKLYTQMETIHFRQDHPLQAAAEKWKERIGKLLERIKVLKDKVLAGTVSKLKVKEVLSAIRTDCEKSVGSLEQQIARCENIGKAYHEAGKSLRNFTAALGGKEGSAQAKANGKLTAAVTAPLRRQAQPRKAVITRMDKAIASIESTLQKQEVKPKSSLLQPMRENTRILSASRPEKSPEKTPTKTPSLA